MYVEEEILRGKRGKHVKVLPRFGDAPRRRTDYEFCKCCRIDLFHRTHNRKRIDRKMHLEEGGHSNRAK